LAAEISPHMTVEQMLGEHNARIGNKYQATLYAPPEIWGKPLIVIVEQQEGLEISVDCVFSHCRVLTCPQPDAEECELGEDCYMDVDFESD